MTSHHRWPVCALSLVALGLLTGCGSSEKSVAAGASVAAVAPAAASTGTTAAPTAGAASAAPAAAIDPCTLLTAAQVSAATGGTVGEGKSEATSGPLGGRKCNWTNDGSPVIDFQVTVQTDADITAPGETTQSLFDQTTTTFPGLTAAGGIGSKAFFGRTQGYVLVGKYLVTTVADIGGTADSSGINKTLTTMAIAKL